MKKRISILLIAVLTLLVVTACGDDKASDSGLTKVKIGVSPSPHSEIVKFIQEDLKSDGVDLKILEFTDYVTPNQALEAGDVDMNFFQHLPYLEDFIAKENVKLASIGGVHIEPMAVYSKSIKDITELKDGAEIGIPNDTVNGGRALLLLEQHGLIKLDENVGIEANDKDIVENKHNYKFTALEAAALPRVLGDVDIAVINGNYALSAGLNPLKDGLIIEDKDSPYVNILAVREKDKEDENLLKVVKALNSDKLKTFILENYDGAVVPAF